MAKVIKVLSLDGGGVRGLFQLKLLALLEQELKTPLWKIFDIVIGTSSGAILAATVALGLDLNKTLASFEKHSKDIFNRRYAWLSFFRPKHSISGLKRFLQELFDAGQLSNVRNRLIIPLVDEHNRIELWESKAQEIGLSKVLLGATLAPIYFDIDFFIGEKRYLDGGIVVNNPSFLLVNKFMQNKLPLKDIKMISLGSGEYPDHKKYVRYSGYKDIARLIDTFYFSQVNLVDDLVKSHLSPEQYLRINPILDEIYLDNAKRSYLNYLENNAVHYYREHRTAILEFIK